MLLGKLILIWACDELLIIKRDQLNNDISYNDDLRLERDQLKVS